MVLAEQLRNQFEQAASTVRLKTGSRGSMKSQMKKADQSGATLAIILGEREWEAQEVLVKNLSNGEQSTIALEALAEHLINTL